MDKGNTVTLQDIYAARRRIRTLIKHTPLVKSRQLSRHIGAEAYLKLETHQWTNSFKLRGAANFVSQMSAAQRERGVVTVSTGNHGKAVASVARRLGARATIFVPELVLPHKVEAIRRLGAEVVVQGRDQDAAEAHAASYADRQGMALIPPFDDPAIIAGQGTLALEILDDLPEVDTIVAPLSGGGLMSGIALVAKQVQGGIRTVGVSMDRSPVMYWSVLTGRPVHLPEERTLADSLMGGIGLTNRYTLDLVRRCVDDLVLVSEREIAASMVYALTRENIVVEGGGAVGIGAALFGKLREAGDVVVIVVSGGNADLTALRSLLADESTLEMLPEIPTP